VNAEREQSGPKTAKRPLTLAIDRNGKKLPVKYGKTMVRR
jgi:hypothetical protein